MALVSFMRKAVTIATRLYSSEKDKVVYTVPAEHTEDKRSLAIFRRIPTSKSKTTIKSDVLRVRDVLCYAGTPNERIASATVGVSYSFPKGMATADMTAMIDDAAGLAAHTEVSALAKDGYIQ